MNMGSFPQSLRPYTNAESFTYRRGNSLLLRLESLVEWLNDELVIHINKEIADLSAGWATNVTALIGLVNAAIAENNADIDEKITAQEAAFNAIVTQVASTIAQHNIDFDNLLAEQAASFAETIQQVVNSSIVVSDPVISGVLNEADSESRERIVNAIFGQNVSDGSAAKKALAYVPFHSALATGGAFVYILGHSVVNGSSSSTPANAFPALVRVGIQNIDPLATINVSGNPGKTSAQILALFDSATPNQNSVYTSLNIFMGLLNDYSVSVDPATTKANVLAIIAKLKMIQPAGRAAAPFLIVGEWLRGDANNLTYPWEDYISAVREIAAADPSVIFLPVGSKMGAADIENVNGFYSNDLVHLTDTGHRAVAESILSDIMPSNPFRYIAERARVSLIQIDPKMGAPVFAVGFWQTVVNAASVGNGLYNNGSSSVGDSTSWDVVLSPGTWSFSFMTHKNVNGGIVTVKLDNGYNEFTTLGTFDTYASAPAYNVMNILNGIVLTGNNSLRRRLRLEITGRNPANTTGFALYLQSIQLHRYV